ncbi:hypothetical protein WDW89_11860 [Deltaproteobacteria bacterium TL4]
MFRKIGILLWIIMSMTQVCLAQQAVTPPAALPAVPPAETDQTQIQIKDPVMKSVFWNTLMGSAWGAIMGSSIALADSSADFRESLLLGTTLGGLFGYGFGIVLVIKGLSFDPAIIPESPLPNLRRRQAGLFYDRNEDFQNTSFASASHTSKASAPWDVKTTIFYLRF